MPEDSFIWRLRIITLIDANYQEFLLLVVLLVSLLISVSVVGVKCIIFFPNLIIYCNSVVYYSNYQYTDYWRDTGSISLLAAQCQKLNLRFLRYYSFTMENTYQFLNHPELADEYRSAMLTGESEIDFHTRVIIDNIFNLDWQEQAIFWREILDYNYHQGLVPGNKTTNWWNYY